MDDERLTDWQDRLAADPRLSATDGAIHPQGQQPVHTVYVGAHQFDDELVPRWGALARRAWRRYAEHPASSLDIFGLAPHPSDTDRPDTDLPDAGRPDTDQPDPGRPDTDLAARVHDAVTARLSREPIEDLRIDFEDGYGRRDDDEEDAHAVAAAEAIARAGCDGRRPSSVGLRIKALEPLTGDVGSTDTSLAARGLRTLHLVLTTLAEQAEQTDQHGAWPEHFVVTLPKVVSTVQVEILAEALTALETETGLPDGALKVELMIETTRSFVDHDGRFLLPRLSAAADGRCIGAHLGTFDLTASWGVAAPHQHLRHPACDAARTLMKLAWAQRGPWLCDGSTHVLPIEPHDIDAVDGILADARWIENERAVHSAWKLHARHVRLALEEGFPQGWDLHPHQLPARFAALAHFHLAPLAGVQRRLAALIAAGASGTATGGGAVQDDAATGQALLDLLRRGLDTGFVPLEEAFAAGLTVEDLATPSLPDILARRDD